MTHKAKDMKRKEYRLILFINKNQDLPPDILSDVILEGLTTSRVPFDLDIKKLEVEEVKEK